MIASVKLGAVQMSYDGLWEGGGGGGSKALDYMQNAKPAESAGVYF